ncbi:MAG: class I SAM-dependent methyltransferase [Clostridium sp.]
MAWNYYTPEFECDKYNRDMLKYSPWSGHRLFGYDLIANLKPNVVVELGSFYGCSMFAFAQAVKDLKLDTVLYGVDLWETFDKFTEQDYKEDIYGAFLRVKETCFGQQHVKMMKMTFDQAAECFEEGSIDVLHIDGSHFYEDVKHDFEIWSPKLKKNSIVLFHDIGDEIINGGIMGSHTYWNELKEQYPWNMQFDFSCGLGVLFMSEEIYRTVTETVKKDYYQKQANSFDVQMKDDLRKLSFKLKDAEFYISDLKHQLEIKDSYLEKYKADRKKLQDDYEATIQKKDTYIAELEKAKEQCNSVWQKDRKKLQDAYEVTIQKKDEYISELEGRLKEIR